MDLFHEFRDWSFSGFIPLNDAIDLFPGHAKKHNYKKISTDTIKLNKATL